MTEDDDFHFAANNTTVRCLTAVIIVVIVCSFGACLYHCESQADRRIRCVELMHDVEKCSKSFEVNK